MFLDTRGVGFYVDDLCRGPTTPTSRANSSVGLRNAVGRAPSQISTVATGGAVPRRDQIVKLLTDTDSSTPPGTPPRILAKRVSINFSCKSFGRSTYCVDLHLDSFHLSSFGYALIRYLLEIHTTSFSFLPCQAPQPGRNAGRMLRKPSNRHIW